MKLGVLTSSRADFGVYKPLLDRLQRDSFFEFEIIAFGTHTSRQHGFTANEILETDYPKVHLLTTLLSNDDAASVASSYGYTTLKFAGFWESHKYDLVFCLGDRFEMSAAVQAGIPFNINFAHLYGGETTLGAMDEIYRHQISLASVLHFTSTEAYARRVGAIMGSNQNIHPVGSLSLDAMDKRQLPDEEHFRNSYQIPPGDFALVTFHPETNAGDQQGLVREMKSGLHGVIERGLNLIITMPNADTQGSHYRQALKDLKLTHHEKVVLIENFGKLNYFAAMRYCLLLVGNTSSGIVEAASFGKYVVNVGDRQKGRTQSKNTFDCSFRGEEIVARVEELKALGEYHGTNEYYRENVAEAILKPLKSLVL